MTRNTASCINVIQPTTQLSITYLQLTPKTLLVSISSLKKQCSQNACTVAEWQIFYKYKYKYK